MESPVSLPLGKKWETLYSRVAAECLAMREAAEEAAAAAAAAAAEAEAAAAEVMAGTIEVTLGALLRAMDSTGDKFPMRKEADEDSGKSGEMQRLAKALTEEFTSSTGLAPERRKKLMKQQAAMARYAMRIEEARAFREAYEALVREGLASHEPPSLFSRRAMKRQDLNLPKRKDMNKHMKNQQAEEAVEDMNSQGSASFIQGESKNVSGKRLEMKEIRPEMQLYAEEEDYFHKAILRALVDIKEKLAKKKTDDDTLLLLLLLLKGMSDRLDQGAYGEKVEIDKGKSPTMACLDTNQGTHTTMVESDIKPAADPSATNSIAIQAATLQMVKDFSDSIRSTPAMQEHTPMVGSDKLLIQPADPSSTDSMTRPGPYSIQYDLDDHDEMSEEEMPDEEMSYEEMPDEEASVDKKMAYEAKKFADYRMAWEGIWSETCGSFEHMTALSSMQFTCYSPAHRPLNVSTPETLQIFSIKLAEISGGLALPLSVYGVVAVRDVVDHNRNYLFYCDRNNSQELKKNDPFLHLIGPSRAVVHEDTVNFEIQLRVKGTTRSQDKALITEGRTCDKIFDNGASTVCIENCLCKIELCVQMVRSTIQATILGVQVVNPTQWPFKYGGRVACSSLPGKIHVTEDKQVTSVTYPASGELVMVDSKDGAKLNGGNGYIHLSRNVVSVEDQGRLDVGIQAYSKSGGIAAQRLVSFPAEYSKITMKECFFGHVKVVITIAWSRVPKDKFDVMSDMVQACGS